MKKQLIKYGSTSDYRSMVKTIAHMTRFEGIDDQGKRIYNNNPLPILTLTGTVKVHGSNWGLSLQNNELICMSRNNLLGDTGHFGFPEIVAQEKKDLLSLFEQIKDISNYKPGDIITLYGEIIGPGIQKGVGVSELPQKILCFFAARITPDENNDPNKERWVQDIHKLTINNTRIFNIHSFKTYCMTIDFEKPQMFQNELNELTTSVGDQCPVAKSFGVEGIGEGIVWTTFYKGQRLIAKIKDERHTSSKIKKMANIDPVVLQSIDDFVNYSCTTERMDQAIFEVGQTVTDIWDKCNTGLLINWIKSDIVKECIEELKDSKLEFKQVAGPISKKMSQYYFERMANEPI